MTPITIPPTPEQPATYVRSDWRHWARLNNNVCNTRERLIIEKRLAGKIVKCKINKGRWIDTWTGEQLSSTRLIDVDHVVPLQEAAQSGGATWSYEKKLRFANDPANLVIASQTSNRRKGSKGPDEWIPEKNKCLFVRTWVDVKFKYGLSFDRRELSAVNNLLKGC